MSKCRQEFDPEGFKRFCQHYPLSDAPEFNAQVEANEPIVSLLTEIRDLMLRREDELKTLKRQREKARVRMAKKRACSRMFANIKEGKGKRETFPPAPPIERKGESPEKATAVIRTCARVCACAREGLTPECEAALVLCVANRYEMKTPPCRCELLAWAHRVWRLRTNDALLNATFEDLRQNGWTDSLTGKRVKNWSAYIRAVLRNKLPPREVIKATLFKKKKPENVLDMTEEQIMKLWGINDGQG